MYCFNFLGIVFLWVRQLLNNSNNKIGIKYDLILFVINVEKEKYGCYEKL